MRALEMVCSRVVCDPLHDVLTPPMRTRPRPKVLSSIFYLRSRCWGLTSTGMHGGKCKGILREKLPGYLAHTDTILNLRRQFSSFTSVFVMHLGSARSSHTRRYRIGNFFMFRLNRAGKLHYAERTKVMPLGPEYFGSFSPCGLRRQ